MEHAWAWWWIFPAMMFFWWGPHRHRRPSQERGVELDDETRARLALVDQLESRVSELENRLDFTERLLAGRTGAAGAGAGADPRQGSGSYE
jgi:hypothetical protein